MIVYHSLIKTGFLYFILFQYTITCQNNARSYDTNDWIPVSQPYQNGNQNFPQLHAVHAKPNKIENGRIPQAKEQRLNTVQHVLSPPPIETAEVAVQGLPFIQQHTPFVNHKNIEDNKQFFEGSNQNNYAQHFPSTPQKVNQLEPVQHSQEQEVQLLYVPLETLRQREQRQHILNNEQAATQTHVRFVDQKNLVPEALKQVQLQNIQHDFIQQALQHQKLQHQLQEQSQNRGPLKDDLYNFQPQEPSTRVPTTHVKKRKPHQPPLAVYMDADGQNTISVSDVLSLLKDAKTITVQDFINEESPKVFVGPSTLQSSERYVKFNLPYLSSIDKQKRDGLEQLPFFVAPLNYRTPPGYSKIPFPSPHVGSVVINQRKHETQEIKSSPYDQFSDDKKSYNIPSNENRQQYSKFPLSQATPTSSVISEIPYGPFDIKQQPHEQTYTTPSSVISSRKPSFSTTPRTYTDSQAVSPNLYSNNKFLHGNVFSTSTTEKYISSSTQPYLNYQDPHVNQNPEVNVFNYNNKHFENIKNRPTNRYLPEQSYVSSSTTEHYVENEHQNEGYIQNNGFPKVHNNDKQNIANTQQEYETVTPRGKYQFKNNADAQEHRFYQNHPVNNRNNTKTEEKILESKPYSSTETYYIDNNPKTINQYLGSNQEYHQPQIKEVTKYNEPKEQPQYIPQQQSTRLLNNYQNQEIKKHRFSNVETHEEPKLSTTERQLIEEVFPPRNTDTVYFQQYKLPADLPISPQLPGLVNSLEDQAIRPLLAPLLLPSAEEADLNHEYREPPNLSTLSPIQAPVPSKPPVARVSPNTQPPLGSSELGYNKEHLPTELSSASLKESFAQISVLPQSNDHLQHSQSLPVHNPDIEISPHKLNTYSTIPQTTIRPSVISSTPTVQSIEITTTSRRLRGRPRGTRPTTSPTRTRSPSTITRGRRPYQDTSKQEYSENQRSTTERATYSRNRYSSRERSQPTSTTEQYREVSRESYRDISKEQTRENNYQKRFRTRGRPIKTEEEIIISTEKIPVSSTEFVGRIELSTDSASRSSQEIIHVTPAALVSSTEEYEKKYFNSFQNEQPLSYLINGQHIINQNTQSSEEVDPQILVSNNKKTISEEIIVEKNNEKVTKEPEYILQEVKTAPVDQSQYLVETSKVRTRGRTRDRVRTRPTVQTTSTTTATTTQADSSNSENSDEFFGFFRQPNFKPLKMEYKPSSELRTTGAIQQSTFSPNYVDKGSTFYINDVRSSTPRIFQLHNSEVAYEDSTTDYLSSRDSSPIDNSYGEIKPVTIRTVSSRRKPTIPAQASLIQEINPDVADRTVNVHPKQKIEISTTPKTIKIRSRIRRPTISPEKQISSEESYSPKPQVQREQTSHPRIRNRGKTHFKTREDDKFSQEEDVPNYPPNFLKQEYTERPSFKLTVVADDTSEEQEGAYSNHYKSKEIVKGEESQRYEKTVQSPNDINTESNSKTESKLIEEISTTEETPTPSETIPSNVNSSNVDISNDTDVKVTEPYLDVSTEASTSTSLSNQIQENISDIISSIMASEEEESSASDAVKTDAPLNIEENISDASKENKTETRTVKKGRRGAWRLVGQRPLDMFQSAESQNIGTVFVNNVYETEKEYKMSKYKNNIALPEEREKDKLTQEIIGFTTEMPLVTDLVSETNVINGTGEDTNEDMKEDIKEDSSYNENNEKTEAVTKGENLTNIDPETTQKIEETIFTEITTVASTGEMPNVDNLTEENTNTNKEPSFFDKLMSSLEKYSATSEKPVVKDDFWKSKIIRTSTTTEVSHETEICYKGRCIKSLM